MDNPFSWDYLTTAPDASEVFGPLSISYLVLIILGLIGASILYNRPTILSSRHLLRRATTRFWASAFIWIFLIGLFFFVIRWLQINPFGFGEPIWMFLTLLVAILAGVLVVLQIRDQAPQLSAEVARAQHDRRRGIATRRPPRRSRRRKR